MTSLLDKSDKLVSRSNNNNDNKNKVNNDSDSLASISDEDNVPYNYIIIIDAGSKGSRAYIYNWKSVKYMLENDMIDLEKIADPNYSFLPEINFSKEWHKKIKPGIWKFYENSSNIGPPYLNHLLKSIYKIIPIEQHYRTPIFLHATSGLRVLNPTDQNHILGNICKYLQTQTNFFLPDCRSHINTIDGDIEGLYGWITLNYLLKNFDNNKGNENNKVSTSGLLELGEILTKISFQPHPNQIKESNKELITLSLSSSNSLHYELFSTSFLGYGLNQIKTDHINYLINNNDNSGNIIEDPCSPVDYSTNTNINNINYQIAGSSNYNECKKLIYDIFVSNADKRKDKEMNDENLNEISSCLLTKSMPNFDLNNDNFIGISHLWDTISNLLDFQNNDDPHTTYDDNLSMNGKIYNYDEIESEASKICNMSLLDLKNNKKNLNEEDSINLCFNSNYLITLLHSGLGLSKNSSNNKFTINDKINNNDFTWTLGRAILYAADESSREIYNYTKSLELNDNIDNIDDIDDIDDIDYINNTTTKIGYFHNSSPGLFNPGSEIFGVENRPDFKFFKKYDTPGFWNFEESNSDGEFDNDEEIISNFDHSYFISNWFIIFMMVVLIICYHFFKVRIRKVFYFSLKLIRSLLNYKKYINNDIELQDANNNEDDYSNNWNYNWGEVNVGENNITNGNNDTNNSIENDISSDVDDFEINDDESYESDGIERAIDS